MAGETAISTNSSTGLYLTAENNGGIAANDPATIELGGGTGLVLASGYMYFDDVIALETFASAPLTDENSGWSFGQDGTTYLKTKAATGGGKVRSFRATVQVTSTQQQNFEVFWEIHQGYSSTIPQLYLLRQWAAATFKNFPYSGALKKYAPIVPVDYSLVEASKEGKNVQTLIITLVNAVRINRVNDGVSL